MVEVRLVVEMSAEGGGTSMVPVGRGFSPQARPPNTKRRGRAAKRLIGTSRSEAVRVLRVDLKGPGEVGWGATHRTGGREEVYY